MLFMFRQLPYQGMSHYVIRCVPKWEISLFLEGVPEDKSD